MSDRSCEAVGIDLGTTFSALAYMDKQQIPRIVPDRQGNPVTPSVVYFDDGGMPVVGDVALDKAVVCGDRAVQFVKVHMGDEWSFSLGEQVHTPESISAMIVAHLLRETEPQIGQVRKAVITVPAFFTEKRRRATQQAGEIAGMEVIGTLHEPVAAALAYGLHRTELKEHNTLIYDLGGGTFDVTVVRITPHTMEELAICGNRQLGGKDWDKCLIDLVVREFSQQMGIDLAALARNREPEALQATQDLQITCEKVKRHLSSLTKTEIKLQAFGRSFRREITRQEFEALTAHLVNLTKLTTNQAIKDAGFVTREGRADWSKIERAVLVGGSTQMPMVRQMLQQISGKPPDIGINPVTAVALGAAVYAQILETGQGPRAIALSPCPTSAPIRFVTAHGVGIRATQQGVRVNDVLIHKNTPVPAEVTRRYLTRKRDGLNQPNRINIVVTQGDTPDPEAVEVLGTASFTGVPPNEPAGRPVEVTLAFDAQGSMHLFAVYTKQDQSCLQLKLELEVPGGLRQEEVEMYRQHFEETGLI